MSLANWKTLENPGKRLEYHEEDGSIKVETAMKKILLCKAQQTGAKQIKRKERVHKNK